MFGCMLISLLRAPQYAMNVSRSSVEGRFRYTSVISVNNRSTEDTPLAQGGYSNKPGEHTNKEYLHTWVSTRSKCSVLALIIFLCRGHVCVCQSILTLVGGRHAKCAPGTNETKKQKQKLNFLRFFNKPQTLLEPCKAPSVVLMGSRS